MTSQITWLIAVWDGALLCWKQYRPRVASERTGLLQGFRLDRSVLPFANFPESESQFYSLIEYTRCTLTRIKKPIYSPDYYVCHICNCSMCVKILFLENTIFYYPYSHSRVIWSSVGLYLNKINAYDPFIWWPQSDPNTQPSDPFCIGYGIDLFK